MGVCCSKSKVDNVVDPHPNEDVEIKEVKDLKFSPGDFIAEKKGNFKDYYEYGRCLGKGDLGEVRVCVNRGTGTIRAVKILK